MAADGIAIRNTWVTMRMLLTGNSRSMPSVINGTTTSEITHRSRFWSENRFLILLLLRFIPTTNMAIGDIAAVISSNVSLINVGKWTPVMKMTKPIKDVTNGMFRILTRMAMVKMRSPFL